MCKSGFKMAADGYCRTIMNNCVMIKTEGQCLTCETGYKLTSNKCVPITDQNCLINKVNEEECLVFIKAKFKI